MVEDSYFIIFILSFLSNWIDQKNYQTQRVYPNFLPKPSLTSATLRQRLIQKCMSTKTQGLN